MKGNAKFLFAVKLLMGVAVMVTCYGVVATVYPGPVLYEAVVWGDSDGDGGNRSGGSLDYSDCFEVESASQLLVRTKYVRDITRVKRNSRNRYEIRLLDPQGSVALEKGFKHRVKRKRTEKEKSFLKYLFGGNEKSVTVARVDADEVGDWCYRLRRKEREFAETSVSVEMRNLVLPHGFVSIFAGLGVLVGGALLGRANRRNE